MRDDRDIQRPKPALAPEKGRGPHCGKDRRSATVCPCRLPATESLQKCSRCLILPPTWHGNPAKACQVSLSASHLARYSCKSVPGVLSCRLPATESPRKRSRCLFPPSTWHGFPAKVFQVASTRCPPGTETLSRPEKCLPGSREYGRLIEWQAGCHLPRSLRTGRACADKLKDCNIVFSISFSYLCFRPEKIINRKDILTTSINPQSL